VCNQVTCVYLLSPPSAVIWNTYSHRCFDLWYQALYYLQIHWSLIYLQYVTIYYVNVSRSPKLIPLHSKICYLIFSYTVVSPQEAKYLVSWPSTISAWAGWSRFDIPVDWYGGVHSLLICISGILGSPTCHQASQRDNTYWAKYQKANRASTLCTLWFPPKLTPHCCWLWRGNWFGLVNRQHTDPAMVVAYSVSSPALPCWILPALQFYRGTSSILLRASRCHRVLKSTPGFIFTL
jgi:hypothetical protein